MWLSINIYIKKIYIYICLHSSFLGICDLGDNSAHFQQQQQQQQQQQLPKTTFESFN